MVCPLQGYYPLEPEMLLLSVLLFDSPKGFYSFLFASLITLRVLEPACARHSKNKFFLCSRLLAALSLCSLLCTLFYPPRPVGTPPWKVGEFWLVLGNCSLLCFSLFQHFLYVLAGLEYVVANTAGCYAKHVSYLATAIAFEPKGHDYRLPTGKVGYNVHYLLYVVPAVNIGHCGLAVLFQAVVAAVGKALMVFVGVSYLVLEDVVGHGNSPCLETAYGAVGVKLVHDM